MGLWVKLFSRTRRSEQPVVTSVTTSTPDLVQIAGTTTFASQGAADAAARHAAHNGGYAEVRGSIEGHESHVMVDGLRIGNLPSYKAQELGLAHAAKLPVLVQIFTSGTPKGTRVDAWAWFGPGPPQWHYGRSNRPPVTTDQWAREAQAETHAMVSESLAEGGFRAEEFRRGMVNGVHYLELVEPIKQLKREGRLEEALELCYRAIEGAEKTRGIREPAPWYTLQAAIVHRKLRQKDAEIAVLQRWMDFCPADRREGSQVAERLAKLTV